jgi:hypothetical protein
MILAFASHHKTLSVAIGLFLTVNLMTYFVSVDTQQPGLLRAVAIRGAIDEHPIRDNERNPLRALTYLPKKEPARRNIVWIGNSQQHAINQPKAGDELASVILHMQLNGHQWPGDRPVFGLSYPNLGYAEIFSLIYALSRLPDRKPDVVILGLRFQDTKEIGYRKEFLDLLDWEARDMQLTKFLTTKQERKAIDHLQGELGKRSLQQAEENTIENMLSSLTGAILPAYRHREQLQSLVLTKLYWARNFALGIKTSSKRPLLKGRYETALQYLTLSFETARQSGMRLFVYNIPMRPGVETPYVQSEYEGFRQNIRSLCQEYCANFKDYDDLIPEQEWGIWDGSGEIDYMHFTGEGHKRLAKTIHLELNHLLAE